MKSPRLPLNAALLALATLLLTACEGPDRKALVEEIRHSVPTMLAHEAYFDGQIVVRLRLGSNVGGAALFGGREGGASSKMTSITNTAMGENKFGSGSSPLGGVTGGSMGSNAMGGGSMGGGGMSSPEMETNTSEESRGKAKREATYQGNKGMNHIAEDDDVDSPAARRAREAQMPPALLRLQLENPSAATVVVEIREVNSDLGNFAIRPDTVTLAPGQSLEVDPMQSMLGVDSYALPVTITLRAGGQTQTKVLVLRPVAPDAGTPPPPAK